MDLIASENAMVDLFTLDWLHLIFSKLENNACSNNSLISFSVDA